MRASTTLPSYPSFFASGPQHDNLPSSNIWGLATCRAGNDAHHRSRRYPGAPLVGVGVAIYNEQGELLLVRRASSGKGTWGLPGGLLDLGEKVEAAEHSEILEELGIPIALGALVTTFEYDLSRCRRQGRVSLCGAGILGALCRWDACRPR